MYVEANDLTSSHITELTSYLLIVKSTGLVFGHINHCRLLIATSFIYTRVIKYISRLFSYGNFY